MSTPRKRLETPIRNSYWLIEGRLLAGEYPGANDDARAREKLEAMLGAGIRSFIDLTDELDPLWPYEPLLMDIAREMAIDVRYQRHPICDNSIPSTEAMAEILSTIRDELAAGRPVYFHCWGGIGRTGTVAGCWLVAEGLSCEEAFEKIGILRAQTPHGWSESPHTDVQREFVRAWKGR